MAAAAIPLIVAGGAIGAIGAIRAGNVAQQQAEAQAAADRANAAQAEQNAQISLQQAAAKESQQRVQARQVLGAQRAAIAQNDIGWGGTAADIMSQSAASAELDALNIRYQGDIEARGFRYQSAMDTYNAKQAQIAGANAKTSSYFNAAGSILGAGGSVATVSALRPAGTSGAGAQLGSGSYTGNLFPTGR